MEEDEREIIYIALSNSLLHYSTLLESGIELSQDDLEMTQHLMERTLHYIDKYSSEINAPKPIGRPQWK